MEGERPPVNGPARRPASRPWRRRRRSPSGCRRKGRPCRRAPGAPCSRLGSVTAKRIAASRAPRATSGATTPKRCGEGGRRRHIDARRAGWRCGSRPRCRRPARRRRLRRRRDGARGSLGDNDDAGNAGGAVGVFLEGRIPEILRIVLLAGGEMDVGRQPCPRRRRARSRASPAEPSGRLPSRSKRMVSEAAMPAARKAASSAAASCDSRISSDSPSPRLRKSPVIGAEQLRKAVVAELVRLGQRQQLDEEAGKLDDVIMRAPGVAVARADREAEAAIERGRRVEIAHGMDDMVEPTRHGAIMAHNTAKTNRSRERLDTRAPPEAGRSKGPAAPLGGSATGRCDYRFNFSARPARVSRLFRARRQIAEEILAVGVDLAHGAHTIGAARIEGRAANRRRLVVSAQCGALGPGRSGRARRHIAVEVFAVGVDLAHGAHTIGAARIEKRSRRARQWMRRIRRLQARQRR